MSHETEITIELNPGFATRKDIPTCITGIVLRETERALLVKGHGDVGQLVTCVRCGRKLTHPVSKLVGIGPECGGHWWDESVLGPYGFTEAHAEQLKKMVTDIQVEAWVPKSCIRDQRETGRKIKTKAGLVRRNKPQTGPKPFVRFKEGGTTHVIITFPYKAELVAQIKTLSNRRWNKEQKHWSASFSVENIQNLINWGFKLDTPVREKFEQITAEFDPSKVKLDLPEKLYDYQVDGVKFVEAKGGRALIADEMGLGKTPQALAWLGSHPEARPAIIVVPASLKVNWAREAQRWMTAPELYIISGYPKAKDKTEWKQHIVAQSFTGEGPVIIINYDILSKWLPYLPACKTLVVDEVHYIKNRNTQRTKAVRALGKKADHIIGLSGTPIVNRPVEFFPILSMIEPGVFPSFWPFAQKYCGATYNGYGWDFNGASNTDELHRILTSTIMIRRKKEDVLTQLPPKRRSVIAIDLDNRKEYDKAARDLASWLKNTGRSTKAANAEALARFTYLKQLATKGKLEKAIQWVHDYLEEEEKLVVFCHHKKTVNALMEGLAEYSPVKIDGRTPQKDRQRMVDTFQEDPGCRVFVGTMAAKEGLTLTAASATCFFELWWTPGDHDQAEDRVHRIGQEADSVMAYYLIAENTIEEEIMDILDDKREVLASALDGKEVDQESMLGALLHNYLAKAA